jgi:hypothetical protein
MRKKKRMSTLAISDLAEFATTATLQLTTRRNIYGSKNNNEFGKRKLLKSVKFSTPHSLYGKLNRNETGKLFLPLSITAQNEPLFLRVRYFVAWRINDKTTVLNFCYSLLSGIAIGITADR